MAELQVLLNLREEALEVRRRTGRAWLRSRAGRAWLHVALRDCGPCPLRAHHPSKLCEAVALEILAPGSPTAPILPVAPAMPIARVVAPAAMSFARGVCHL